MKWTKYSPYYVNSFFDKMEFDSFSIFYEKLNTYYALKLGKISPTKNEVQLMVDKIVAAKVRM